jgi:uncharacterized protein (TIGR02147 family)
MQELFLYDNYRRYLRDWYVEAKGRNPRVSYRFLSRQAGFSSPNFLKLVMDGQRNLSAEAVGKVAKALKLRPDELPYFRHLVSMNQAANTEERAHHAERLLESRFRADRPRTAASPSSYYAHWYNIPVRELVSLPDFREDASWIARQFIEPLQESEATAALESLLALGLIERGSDGRLKQTEAFVSTGDEVSSAFIAQFHREMLGRAAQSLDGVPARLRELSSVTLGLSRANAAKLKLLIQNFRRDLLAVANAPQDCEAVYQVNLQLFPLTQGALKESSS